MMASKRIRKYLSYVNLMYVKCVHLVSVGFNSHTALQLNLVLVYSRPSPVLNLVRYVCLCSGPRAKDGSLYSIVHIVFQYSTLVLL